MVCWMKRFLPNKRNCSWTFVSQWTCKNGHQLHWEVNLHETLSPSDHDGPPFNNLAYWLWTLPESHWLFYLKENILQCRLFQNHVLFFIYKKSVMDSRILVVYKTVTLNNVTLSQFFTFCVTPVFWNTRQTAAVGAGQGGGRVWLHACRTSI